MMETICVLPGRGIQRYLFPCSSKTTYSNTNIDTQQYTRGAHD